MASVNAKINGQFVKIPTYTSADVDHIQYDGTRTFQDNTLGKKVKDIDTTVVAQSQEIENKADKKDIDYSSIISTAYTGSIGGLGQGSYFAGCVFTSDANRLRNISTKVFADLPLIKANTRIEISCDDGYAFAYQVFSILSTDDGIALDNYVYRTSNIVIQKTVDTRLAIAFKRTDGSNMLASEISHLKVQYYSEIKEKIDNKLESNKLTIPFTTSLGTEVYKNGNKYVSTFKPHSKYITNSSGVNVFLSTNGNDTNSGLNVLEPKKTIESALAVSNINTLIFAEGDYTAGIHFTAGLSISASLNLIGIGNVVINSSIGNPITFTNSFYCENIHFKGGNNTVKTDMNSLAKTATFYKCIFSESYTMNGLAVLGGSSYVVECLAYGNAYDGFNYHQSSGNVTGEAFEINCIAYGNGTYNLSGADGQSSNGTTAHDNHKIIRVNGKYYACHGGVVADKDCYSANYGCSAGVSTVTDNNYPDRKSNYWSSNATMYLYDCISYGSKYDTAIIRGGTITSNITYSSNYNG